MKIFKQRNMGVLLVALLLTMESSALGVRGKIEKYIPQSKYRNVLVLVFESNDANPLIGKAAADSMAASLGKMGFTIVDREFARKFAEQRGIGPNPTIDQMRELSKELNISGIIKGIVSETGEHQEQVAGYVQTTNTSYNAWGDRPLGGEIYAKGAETKTIAKFSASASLIDINNGSQIWSGSLADSFTNSSVQAVANSVMDRLAVDMGKRLMSMKY